MVPTIQLAALVPVLSITVNHKIRKSVITVNAGPYKFFLSAPGLYTDETARNYFKRHPERFQGDGIEIAKYLANKM